VAAKERPSRFFRELVSHRVLKSKGIALRVVDVLPAKQAGPRHPHSHPGMEEVIYVENGSGKAWVNGETAKIVRGDTILIPAGARHMKLKPCRGTMQLFYILSYAATQLPVTIS